MPSYISFNNIVIQEAVMRIANEEGFDDTCTHIKEKLSKYCFIFHDVDLIPENSNIPYFCQENQQPTQLSSAIKSNNYR